ncbi:aquaporin [Acrasis kona]|uniref:Aquaporin n=1 Tax=Acrasis kona TaxID=1008807 RepID=A0AAW2ZFG2_9EUKA
MNNNSIDSQINGTDFSSADPSNQYGNPTIVVMPETTGQDVVIDVDSTPSVARHPHHHSRSITRNGSIQRTASIIPHPTLAPEPVAQPPKNERTVTFSNNIHPRQHSRMPSTQVVPAIVRTASIVPVSQLDTGAPGQTPKSPGVALDRTKSATIITASNGDQVLVQSQPTPSAVVEKGESYAVAVNPDVIVESTNVNATNTAYNNDIVPKGAKFRRGRTTSIARQIFFGQGAPEDGTKKITKLKIDARRFLAEFQGTFFLVFFHAGIGAANQWLTDRGLPNLVNPIEFGVLYGFIILALIFALGSVSGAHFNPVVTLAFALRGVFTWWRVPIYWFFQFAGAIVGAALIRAIFGLNAAYCGSNIPPPYSSASTAFGLEIIGTYLFLTVVLSTARASKIAGASAALAVGVCYCGIAILSSYVGTISLNPTRTLAPAIMSGGGPQWRPIWAFICGPVIGTLLAVGSDRLIVSQRGVDYKLKHQTFGQGGYYVE